MPDILVLYYSRNGAVRALAEWIANGIDAVPGAQARLRTVPPVAAITQTAAPPVPERGAPYVEKRDLAECIGLACGSPTRFGNMAAPMKYFWDSTGAEWQNNTLAGKPACVFTSSTSLHGGQESTLLTMMVPLLHHGMLIVGLPYSEPALTTTMSGGGPYGASHVASHGASHGTSAANPASMAGHAPLSDDEKQLARALGKRLAQVALKLAA